MKAAHQYSVQHQAAKRKESRESSIPRLTVALLVYSIFLPGHQEKLDWNQSLHPLCSISQPLLHVCSSFLHHRPSQYVCLPLLRSALPLWPVSLCPPSAVFFPLSSPHCHQEACGKRLDSYITTAAALGTLC